MTTLENHVLYYKPTCPFCAKVTNYMAANDINCELRNTLEPGVAEELIEIGGKKQVPCMVIEGKPMYESDDILEYLGGERQGDEGMYCPIH